MRGGFFLEYLQKTKVRTQENRCRRQARSRETLRPLRHPFHENILKRASGKIKNRAAADLKLSLELRLQFAVHPAMV